MILIVDTSTPIASVTFVYNDRSEIETWQADRQLANGLLGWLDQQLKNRGKTFHDISGMAIYRGPGSFTGLRIGLTVMNTLAESLDVPIVGGTGDDWQEMTLSRLEQGDDDKIVLPYYDRDATITTRRK